MRYSFSCSSHPNITAKHKKSLEFTKDREVTLEGDCIVGVNAGFEPGKIMVFLEKNEGKRILLRISADGIEDSLEFDLNPGFNDAREIVIRKSSFLSSRTLGVNASKAACDFKAELRAMLKSAKNIKAEISPLA